MDVKGSSLEVRWNNYKRSSSRTTGSWPCPKCLDRRPFHREDELFAHVAQHHPEFAEGSREDDRTVAFRTWLDRAQQDEQRATAAAAGSGNRRSVPTGLASPFRPSFKPPFDTQESGGADRKTSRPQRAISTGHIPNIPRARQQKEISDIEKLSLGQDQDSIMVDSAIPLSPIGTRKRAAVAEPSPSDPSNKLRSPDRDRGSARVGLVVNPLCRVIRPVRSRGGSSRIQNLRE